MGYGNDNAPGTTRMFYQCASGKIQVADVESMEVLLAEIERLKAELADKVYQTNLSLAKECDTLRARIEELEAVIEEGGLVYDDLRLKYEAQSQTNHELCEERDELRSKFKDACISWHKDEVEVNELRLKVRGLEWDYDAVNTAALMHRNEAVELRAQLEVQRESNTAAHRLRLLDKIAELTEALEAANDREREALKPKPVVEVFYRDMNYLDGHIGMRSGHENPNIRFTFEDGKLVKAEVINE